MLEALMFDLDDTLYAERDFVSSGYWEIAKHLEQRYGSGAPEPRRLHREMMETLQLQGREHVLPMVLGRLEQDCAIAELVQVYRRHQPEINLYPGCSELLGALRVRYRLGIVTDGQPDVQQRKVEALGLQEMVDQIVYSWSHGIEREKPHPYPFLLMAQLLCAEPSNSLFVGDHPIKDCYGAHRVGMKSVRIRGCRYVATEEDKTADFEIKSLNELPLILEELENATKRNTSGRPLYRTL